MKKIIAILLVIVCMFSVASCSLFGKDEEDETTNPALKLYKDMLATSVPTQSVTVVEHTLGKTKFESTYTLTTGMVDGKAATTLVSEVQSLNDVTSNDLDHIVTTVTKEWYLEGKGTKVNNKAWNEEGKNFAPVAGSLWFNLKEENFSEISYDEAASTLVLTIPADKASTVLGYYIGSEDEFEYDATLTIVAAGGRIVNIKIEYTIDATTVGDIDSQIDIDEIDVVIEATYSYGLQEINMD